MVRLRLATCHALFQSLRPRRNRFCLDSFSFALGQAESARLIRLHVFWGFGVIVAKKIKDTLIHKAKVKKAYAKTLQKEGYGQAGSGSGANSGPLGSKKRGQHTSSIKLDDNDEDDEAAAAGMPTEQEREQERARMRARMRDAMGDDSESDREDGIDDSEDENEGRGAAPSRGRTSRRLPLDEAESEDEDDEPEVEENSQEDLESVEDLDWRNRKPGSTQRQPLPPQAPPSFPGRRPKQSQAAPPIPLDNKKTNATKRKPKLTPHELEELRAKKAAERRAGGSRHRGTGQPRLGNRVELLLGKIQRSMQ